ncbi:hypothetical protein FD754_011994, partial [Muntiacus muntjak]
CSQVNAASRRCRQNPPGIQLKGTLPLEHLGVDFTEMKPHRHYHYLLVMVCTFPTCVKAFPTWTERTSEVARCLLREMVPRFGFPSSIGSGNGPAFVADLVHQVSKTLNIKWKLHIAYRPRVLRRWNEPTAHLERLSKWIRETDCSWMDLLPTALLRLRMTPQSQGYSPYEIVYGRPPPIIKQLSTNLPQVRGDRISQQMELGKVINRVTKFVQERVPFPLGEQIHEFTLGDQVWVKDWKDDLLAPW